MKREFVNRKSVGKLFSEKLRMIFVVKITSERSKPIPNACAVALRTLTALYVTFNQMRQKFHIHQTATKHNFNIAIQVKKMMSRATHYKMLLNIKCFILSFRYVTIGLYYNHGADAVLCTNGFFRSFGIKLFSIFYSINKKKRRNKMSVLYGIIWWMMGFDVSSLTSFSDIHSANCLFNVKIMWNGNHSKSIIPVQHTFEQMLHMVAKYYTRILRY